MNELEARLPDITEAEVKKYGKWMLASAAAFYVSTSFSSSGMPDAKYAIDAHLPQGFDRSVIAARLEQRHTKEVLHRCLGLNQLRDQLRTFTDREAKLRGWQDVFCLTLVGMLAASYTHSLTIFLLTMKNTVRVIIFLLRRRESQALKQKGRRGPLSKVRAWWTGGTKSLVMETLLERMNAQMEQQASPFDATVVEEVPPLPTPPMDGRHAFVQSQMLYMNQDTLTEVDRAFNVKCILDIAIPRIVACASAVVTSALNRRQPGTFSVTGLVTGDQMRGLLSEVAADFERRACVAEWVRPPPRATLVPTPRPLGSASASVLSGSLPAKPMEAVMEVDAVLEDEAGGVSGAATRLSHQQRASDEDDDEIVEFPGGSTVVLDAAGRPSRGSVPRDVEVLEEVFGSGNRQETPEEQAARNEAIRREQLAKEQSAGFFQELIRSASFGELCLSYGITLMERAAQEAGDISGVKSYDVGTDSAKMLMVLPSLEAVRQKLFDADFEVPSYMQLFCSETLRATASP